MSQQFALIERHLREELFDGKAAGLPSIQGPPLADVAFIPTSILAKYVSDVRRAELRALQAADAVLRRSIVSALAALTERLPLAKCRRVVEESQASLFGKVSPWRGLSMS